MKLGKKRLLGLEVALEVVSELPTSNPEFDDELMFATIVLKDILKGNNVIFSDEEKKKIIEKEISRLFDGYSPTSADINEVEECDNE